jgi:RNA polymerase sigma factor (sigma-70 family)
MDQYTTDELIKGVLAQNEEIFMHLYKTAFNEVFWLVRRNNGTLDDANDIFQEALIILIDKISSGTFELTCSPKTYLYKVCHNLWLKELGKRARRQNVPFEELDYVLLEDEVEFAEDVSMLKIYFRHFQELSRECKKILHLHLKKVPIQEITRRLGFKNDSYTMDRKYRCKQSLIKRIEANPQYKKLNEGR